MPIIDCIIIGGGVVGLAIAKKLSQKCQVTVLEKHPHFGMETSSRNSGVIHAGLYYPSDFLKTRLCLRGRDLLYAYCKKHAIGHHRVGKLIVASHAEELRALNKLQAKAQQLNISLQPLCSAELQEKEAAVSGIAALFSPDTGIIDSAAFMLQLQNDIHSQGSQCLNGHEVTDIEVLEEGFLVTFCVNGESHQVQCKTLINAAGLQSQQLSANIKNLPLGNTPQAYFCKGQYFSYSGQESFSHLIYPLPNPNISGLGIHLTLNLDGSIKFGPDAHYISEDDINYRVNEQDKKLFVDAIQRYLPQLQAHELTPDFAGIRPKLTPANQAAADFSICGPAEHGINNLIQCFGIESPGLTASLAIGDYVESLLWP